MVLTLLSPTFRNVFVGLVQLVLICRKQDHLGIRNSHTIDDPLGIDPVRNDWSNPPTWTALGMLTVTNDYGEQQFTDANGTNVPLGFYQLMQSGP